MSHFNKHVWVAFPLLSVLSMSPAVLQTKQAERHLASVSIDEQKTSSHPRFDKLISKVDKSNVSQDITVDLFLQKVGAINGTLKTERELFKKNLNKKEEVLKQRQELEAIVSDVVVLEEELKVLQQKKLLKSEDEALMLKSVADFKLASEELLTDLEVNEDLVAKADKPVEEPMVEEPKVEEPKKDEPVVAEVPKTEEPKKEEPKKEEPKVEEPKKEEDKKEEVVVAKTEEPKEEEEEKVEDKKEDKKEEVCKDEKHKVLPRSAEELVAQQNQILQQMMGMTQMMMMMLQQHQIYQMQQQYQLQGPVNQQAYQYIAPSTGGSWVFQPGGSNRPGLYPDQMNQQPPMQYQQPYPQQSYNGWGLAPQNYFELDPRMNPMPLQPGQFGGAPALGFNMAPVQTPGQMPMVQPPFAPGAQTFQI